MATTAISSSLILIKAAMVCTMTHTEVWVGLQRKRVKRVGAEVCTSFIGVWVAGAEAVAKDVP